MWRHVFVFGLLMVTAAVAVAQQKDGFLLDKPAPTKAIWEVPSNIVLPLEELIEKGFVPVVRKPQGAQTPVLAFVKLETGATVWTLDLPGDVQAIHATKDVLIAAASKHIAGISLADGKVLWQQPLVGMLNTGGAIDPRFGQIQWFKDKAILGQGIGGAFLVVKDRVFVCVGGILYAIDVMTGKVAWQKKLGFSLSYPLTAFGDTVIAATSDNGLGALAADTGKVVWVFSALKDAKPVIVIDEELYAATRDGLFKIDPKTAKILWRAAIPGEGKEKIHPVGDRLIVERDNDVSVLKRDSGEALWRVEEFGLHSAVNKGRIYYYTKSAESIVCVNAEDLKTVWKTTPTDRGPWNLFASGDAVVALTPGLIEGFDAETGRPLWKRESGPGVLYDTSTWAADDKAAFFHLPSEVRGFALRSGRWTLSMPGHFFFVHWMRVQNNTLYLHSGKPNEQSLGAIPLRVVEQESEK
jgi:outer membrane protein assembly factor BamB